MRIPDSKSKLITFAKKQIEVCSYSQNIRAQEAATAMGYYEIGSGNGIESLYNRTGVHIDRTSSYLYAPSEVRYSITFDHTDDENWLQRAKAGAKYLSKEYRRSDADILFSTGVTYALTKGCMIVKHNWSPKDSLSPGLNPVLVHPEFFGVEREDLDRLEDQQCLLHTTYLSKEQIKQLLPDDNERESLMKQIDKMGGRPDGDVLRQNWLHQVVIGGTQPVPMTTPDGTTGQVSVSPSSRTEFHPDMLADLLRVDELWVVDDDRRDYTTIQLVEGDVLLAGKYKHENMTGVTGLHPFSKICPDAVAGYFWGRSEALRVKVLQDLLSERMLDVQRLLKLQVRPPKAMIGFSGMTKQKMRAALAPGGYIQEQSPGAKLENLIPNIPEEVFREITQISDIFDEMGGFKPIMQGQGEPGVRANAHARTLMRTASPNLRKRALRVERDAEESAAIVFKLMQAKSPRVFKTDAKEQFYLAQMPEDYYVEIDSHSASPAFVDDQKELAFAFKKLGVIDDEDTLMMVHPPLEDLLISNARKRKAARAQMMKENPELFKQSAKKARA